MSGAFHRKLVEESTDILTLVDPEGTIRYVSPSATRALGYDPEELVGEVGYEYQHPDDRGDVADAIARLQADPESTQVVETRFRRADGSWCWVEATMQNRLDDETIGGILVSSRDISERKQRQEQYRALADEYSTLLESVDDGIFFLSVESTDSGPVFRFERLNRAYERQTGITTAAVEGETPIEAFGDELGAELSANYHRCVRAGEPIRYREEVPVKTDARFWQTTLTPVFTGDAVTRIIGITRDITDQVKRERQLRSQNEQLEEFAGVVSHDLRNPLTVAEGRAKLLAEESESEHVEYIRRSLDRMDDIVSDTLTLAREGQVVAESAPVALSELVNSCWETVATAEASIETDDDVTVSGDRDRLGHVFENLFRNAVEHGGPDVTVRVGRIPERGLYVEDTGSGIPKEVRETVVEPGHSSASGGTGFGLTIVKRVAEAHGWKLRIAEGADGGARFEFTDVEFVD